MIDFKEKTIAEIVSSDISAASIFKKHQIDFCCGGNKTIATACEEANIDVSLIINDLANSKKNSAIPQLNFNKWNKDFLIDYIVNVHHTYIRQNIDIVNEFGQKVASVHGEHAPETIKISALFSKLTEDLKTHLEKEEKIVFPAIKAKLADSNYLFDTEVIHLLEDEHDNAGTIVKEIQKLSNNFTPPEWACSTYKAFYFKLDEFINDLFQHIHLENNILFSKFRNN